MTVNRTTLLDLPLPVTGTESNTWGDITNNGLTEYMDIAIAGMSNLTSANFTAGALTIETTEGNAAGTSISATSAQYAGFRVTSLAANSTITVGNTGTSPARSYRLINADSTYNLTFKATGQTGVTLLPGQSAVVAFNGTDYVIVGTVGAGTATDNAIARFDGTTGEILQNSAATIDDTGAATFVGSVNVSGTSASGADLKLYEDTDNGTNYVAFKSPASVASNVTWTLPSADGSANQAIVTNGSGTLSFASVTTSPGGSNTQIQYNNSGAFGGSSNLTWDGTNFRTAGNARIEGTGVGLTGTGAGAEIYANSGNVYFQAYNRTTSAYAPVIISGSEVTFTIAAFERMRIDSSGNVGIGTSSPSYLLHAAGTNPRINVSASSTGYAGYRASNTSGTFQVAIDDSTGSNYLGTAYGRVIYSDGAYPLQFATNATERMRITSSGNVGVGTTTPGTYLEVASPSGSGSGQINIHSPGGGGIITKLISERSGPFRISAEGGSGSGITFETGNSVTPVERMRITNTGNVGIGTSSPTTKLDIVGPSTGSALADGVRVSTSIGFGASYGDGLSFYNSNPSYLAQLAGIYPYTSGFSQKAGNLIFATNDSTTYAERMRINYDGTIKTVSTISVGNATPSTSGAGITFPATQSASSDANTLDDYEEGTWTPSLTSSSGSLTTVSNGTGNYTKIGNCVTVTCAPSITTNGTGSGRLIISGLPFARGKNQLTGASREDGVVGFVFGISEETTTSIGLQKYDATYPGGNGYRFAISITYLI